MVVMVLVNVSGTVTLAVGSAWEVEGHDAPYLEETYPFLPWFPSLVVMELVERLCVCVWPGITEKCAVNISFAEMIR